MNFGRRKNKKKKNGQLRQNFIALLTAGYQNLSRRFFSSAYTLHENMWSNLFGFQKNKHKWINEWMNVFIWKHGKNKLYLYKLYNSRKSDSVNGDIHRKFSNVERGVRGGRKKCLAVQEQERRNRCK